jgi:hypothetical protein
MEYITKLEEYMPPTNPYTRLETLLSEHGFEFNCYKTDVEIELRLFQNELPLFQNRVMRFRVALKIPDACQWMLPYPGHLTAEELARHRNNPDLYPTLILSEKFGEARGEFMRYRLHQLCDVIEAHLKRGNSLPDLFPADHCSFNSNKELHPFPVPPAIDM